VSQNFILVTKFGDESHPATYSALVAVAHCSCIHSLA